MFPLIKRTTALFLEMKSCGLVPLAGKFSLHAVYLYRGWMESHLPEWAEMQIKPFAKYLGLFLGPAADGLDFCAPLLKLKARTVAIAESLMPRSEGLQRSSSHGHGLRLAAFAAAAIVQGS